MVPLVIIVLSGMPTFSGNAASLGIHSTSKLPILCLYTFRSDRLSVSTTKETYQFRNIKVRAEIMRPPFAVQFDYNVNGTLNLLLW